jgi:hypothetical protein
MTNGRVSHVGMVNDPPKCNRGNGGEGGDSWREAEEREGAGGRVTSGWMGGDRRWGAPGITIEGFPVIWGGSQPRECGGSSGSRGRSDGRNPWRTE